MQRKAAVLAAPDAAGHRRKQQTVEEMKSPVKMRVGWMRALRYTTASPCQHHAMPTVEALRAMRARPSGQLHGFQWRA
jgi:hypothetical protein